MKGLPQGLTPPLKATRSIAPKSSIASTRPLRSTIASSQRVEVRDPDMLALLERPFRQRDEIRPAFRRELAVRQRHEQEAVLVEHIALQALEKDPPVIRRPRLQFLVDVERGEKCGDQIIPAVQALERRIRLDPMSNPLYAIKRAERMVEMRRACEGSDTRRKVRACDIMAVEAGNEGEMPRPGPEI